MEVELTFFAAGYCTHDERMVLRTGAARPQVFPSMFALIRHPSRGYILYDTGYSPRFHGETRRFPASIYAKLTPVFLEAGDTAAEQLAARGIPPDEIEYVFLSHFHADHVGGLRDFPRAKLLYFQSCFDAVRDLRGLRAVFAGFLPGLLPPDFVERSATIDRQRTLHRTNPLSRHFAHTFDVFGDESIIAVELPGHTRGQLGLYLRTQQGERFLVADSCWLSRSYRENVMPSILTAVIADDYSQYRSTLDALHQLSMSAPEITIVPSHCPDFLGQHVPHGRWREAAAKLAGEEPK